MSLFKRFNTVAGALARKTAINLIEGTLKANRLDHVDGIAVCDMAISRTDAGSQAFLRLTRESMVLIKSLDSRRHRRICRHVDYIVNMPLTSAGNFDRKLNICHIDYDKMYASANPEWACRMYACLLIHEATHGVLEERYILYLKDKRKRIEGLCHREEYRFALNFGKEWADRNIGPFRPELWAPYWNSSRLDRLKAHWQRIMESLESGR